MIATLFSYYCTGLIILAMMEAYAVIIREMDKDPDVHGGKYVWMLFFCLLILPALTPLLLFSRLMGEKND